MSSGLPPLYLKPFSNADFAKGEKYDLSLERSAASYTKSLAI